MPYDFQILLDSVDVTDKVSGFTVSGGMGRFCRETSVDFADVSVIEALDFSVRPTEPLLEIKTRTGANWYSQGHFFIERPVYSREPNQRVANGVWGRSTPAFLDAPFAPGIIKTWDKDALFSGIAAELCALCGVDYQIDIQDFLVPANTLCADGERPVDILSSLAAKAGAVLACDRLDRLRVKDIDYAPSAASHTLTDSEIQSVSEELDIPDYGNRVRVEPAALTSGYRVEIVAPDVCLAGDGTTNLVLYARVTDGDGNPVQGAVVNWTLDDDSLVEFDGPAAGNTGLLTWFEEQLRVSKYTILDLLFPPKEILSVRRVADPRLEFEYGSGAGIDGNQVTLASNLPHCDSLVRVAYCVDGVAKVWLKDKANQAGVVTVTAECSGAVETVELFVNEPCECPVNISLDLAETTLAPGASASILVAAEQAGKPLYGRKLFMEIVEGGSYAALRWNRITLDRCQTVERTQGRNDVAGVSRLDLKYPAWSVAYVLRVYKENTVGQNLYASHDGKTVTLNAQYPTGTQFEVGYVVDGARSNSIGVSSNGASDGAKVRVRAYVESDKEEADEAFAEITVQAGEGQTSDADSDPANTTHELKVCHEDDFNTDEDCPQNALDECNANDLIVNLDRLSCCLIGQSIGVKYAVQIPLSELLTIAKKGPNDFVLALRANQLHVTDGTNVGRLRLKWDEDSEDWYPDGAFLKEG